MDIQYLKQVNDMFDTLVLFMKEITEVVEKDPCEAERLRQELVSCLSSTDKQHLQQ